MDVEFPEQCRSRFRPERLLASGGFGSVYLATQINLDRRVAIKLLKSDILQDPEQVGRFLAEARITASLSHPNVVVILDHAVEDGVPWIAYEFLPGRSVRAMLEAGPLSPREALTVASQVAAALARAHDHKILHRDIKPENVLEVEAGFYKVTDFGIAKWTRDGAVHTKTGFLLGTPAYMAPEQVRGEPPAAHSDQYALGVMLFELLTGAPPFCDPHPIKVLHEHVNTVPPPVSHLRPGLPPALDALVARALDKDPERRFPGCLAFKSAIDELTGAFAPAGARSVASGVTRRPAAAGPQATAAGPQVTGAAPRAAAAGPQVTAAGPQATAAKPQLKAAGPQATVAGAIPAGAGAQQTTAVPRGAAEGGQPTIATAQPAPAGAQPTAPISHVARRTGSRKITSTVAVAPVAPAGRRGWLAGGALVSVLAVTGGWLALRPAVAPAVQASASVAPRSPAPVVAPAESPAPAPSPSPSPAAEVPTGPEFSCDGVHDLVEAQDRLKKLAARVREQPGKAVPGVWVSTFCHILSLKGMGGVASAAWLDEHLVRQTIGTQAEPWCWITAATWAQMRDPARFTDAWRRGIHDALVSLALLRRSLPAPGTPGGADGSLYPLNAVILGASNLTLRTHSWRDPTDEDLVKLEWRYRSHLHTLLALRYVSARGLQLSPSFNAPFFVKLNGDSLQATQATFNAVDGELLGALGKQSLPRGASAWLAEYRTRVTSNPRLARAVVTRGLLEILVHAAPRHDGLAPPAGASDPLLALFRVAVLADVPELEAADGRVRLATHTSCAPLRTKSPPGKVDPLHHCLSRLDAAALAAGLGDWLSQSYSLNAKRGEAAIKPLVAPLLEALEWRVALLAGTTHQPAIDEACATLAVMRTTLRGALEKGDSERIDALLAAAQAR